MDVDDLYALPLDRFVPERGTLAKALRADRRRDEAKDVAALRKPSVAGEHRRARDELDRARETLG